MVPASTLPSGPPSTAVTLTLARAGKMVRPTSSARGHGERGIVRKRMPDAVRTTLPATIRLVLVGSRFSKRTVPVALVSSTACRWPGTCRSTATGTLTTLGRHDAGDRVRRGRVRIGDDRHLDGTDRLGSRRDDDRRRRQEQVGADAGDEDGQRRGSRPPMSHGVRIRRPRPTERAADAASRAVRPAVRAGSAGTRWRRPGARDGACGRSRRRRMGRLRAAAAATAAAGTTSPSVPSDVPAASTSAVTGRRRGCAACVSVGRSGEPGSRRPRQQPRTRRRRHGCPSTRRAVPRPRPPPSLVLRDRAEDRAARPTPRAPASRGRRPRSTAASRGSARRATAAGS